MSENLAQILNKHITQSGLSLITLSKKSGVPLGTLRKWVGDSPPKKLHVPDGLLRIGRCLNLSRSEVEILLAAGGQESIETLQNIADQKMFTLLSFWLKSVEELDNFVPCQLRNRLSHFVGRSEMINDLQDILLSNQGSNVCFLYGMAGVGKTSLALHLGYELKPYFKDGVLWGELNEDNLLVILNTFATAYQEDVSHYATFGERCEVVRQILANKNVLIILDNVESSNQIQKLLPPSLGKCKIIVTSRSKNLWAIRGAHLFHVQPFDPKKCESLSLFRKVLGPEKVKENQQDLQKIADLLGHLPLAVDIVAQQLFHQPPDWPIDLLRQNLADFLEYEPNVPASSVWATFNLSYQTLSTQEQTFFAMLSVFSGQGFSLEAVSFVTGIQLFMVDKYLRKLYLLSLIQSNGPQSYQLHPLLKEYAYDKLENKTSAIAKMVQFYKIFVIQYNTQVDLLEAELQNLENALEQAYQQKLTSYFLEITNKLYDFWLTRGLYHLAEKHLNQAEYIVREIQDVNALVYILLKRGILAYKQCKHQIARTYLTEGLGYNHGFPTITIEILYNLVGVENAYGSPEKAKAYAIQGLEIARHNNEIQGQIKLLEALGVIVGNTGDYHHAKIYLRESLALAKNNLNEDFKQIGKILCSLSKFLCNCGDYDEAGEHLQHSLELLDESGDYLRKSQIYILLARVHIERFICCQTKIKSTSPLVNLNDLTKAKEYILTGLTLAKKSKHQECIAMAYLVSGFIKIYMDELKEAEFFLNRGLQIAEDINHSWLPSDFKIKLGQLYLHQKKPDQAKSLFTEALKMALSLNILEYIAEAHYGLSKVMFFFNKLQQALDYARESLNIFSQMNHVKRDEVQRWIEDLNYGF